MKLLKTMALSLISALIFSVASVGAQTLKMETLSVANGLSSNVVYDIVQDSVGYIWIATDMGLDRYDGRGFKNYLYRRSDIGVVNDARINCLFCAADGKLLIGTEKGINFYDRNNDMIKAVAEFEEVALENIRTINQNNGYLWIGTNHGLFRYKAESHEWTHIDTSNSGLVNDIVRAVMVDNDNVFIGTFDGVSRYNMASERWDSVKLKPSRVNYPVNNLVLSIIQSPFDDGELLIGTQTGLCELDKTDLSFRVYEHYNTGSMVNNTIKTMYFDGDVVWLGSEEGLMSFDGHKFDSFVYNPDDIYSLPSNVVWRVMKDRSGVMWLATEEGVAKHNSNVPNFDTFDLADFDGNPYAGLEIFGACTDNSGRIWLGSRKGLSVCDMNSQTMRWINMSNTVAGTYNFTKGLVVDNNNILWVGTAEGIICYDLERNRELMIQRELKHSLKYINTVTRTNTGDICIAGAYGQVQIIQYQFDPVTRSFIYVTDTMTQFDRPSESMAILDNDIWLSSIGDGLLRYDIQTGRTVKYYHSENEPSIRSNIIHCLYADQESDMLWIGTTKGLDCYDAASGKFIVMTEKGSVQSVYSICGDTAGHIWFSTANSICFYDKSAKCFNFFTLSKWFEPRNSILSASTSCGKDVYMFGLDKCIRLNSSDVESDDSPAPLIISDIEVLNMSLTENGLRTEPLEQTTRLRLNYNQNIVSVRAAMLDYSSPDMIKYHYFMEGYDEQWRVLSGASSDIEYTNLRPGEYTLRINAINGEGIAAANDIELIIYVARPWWRLWYMEVTYVLIVVLVFLFFSNSNRKRMAAEHQLEIERMARDSVEEMNKMKIALFTNISHDLKTPLSLILSPCDSLLEGERDQTKIQNLHLIKQNAQRLLTLVNQILEFRKVNSQKMDVTLSTNDLIKSIAAVCTNFQELAAKKNVTLQFESTADTLICDYDGGKVERIFYNIISNAIKFTATGGQIYVHVQQKDLDCVEVMVADTGIGIEHKDLPHIFERFYQAEDAAIIYNGSGLGLVIVKEFVELLGGTVSVNSERGKGTTFIVTLPIINLQSENTDIQTTENDGTAVLIEASDKNTLLLVEDNEDMRTYLTGELGKYYDVTAVDDAESALDHINNSLPNIIVLDVMLPKMNGLELCHKLKNEFVTSHIPIIMLTARTTDEQVIAGFNAGADEYIGKPFNLKILLSRIDNILVQRQKFRASLKRDMVLASATDIESPDDIFLQKVYTLINDNISDPDLNIPSLCDKLGVSPVNFCRKMKSITDMNPNAFIRNMRLKRAAQLLCLKGMTVTDVMYAVGFNHRSYFSMCFKETFGVTPKMWAMEHYNRSEQNDNE